MTESLLTILKTHTHPIQSALTDYTLLELLNIFRLCSSRRVVHKLSQQTPSDVANVILHYDVGYTLHMRSRWYTLDLHVGTTDI
jgi:hypothetical protein